MSEYVQIEFLSVTADQKDILITKLSAIGFEGFEETEKGLKAFIHSTDYNKAGIEEIAEQQKATFNKTIIEETNWNQVWESNFNPVIIVLKEIIAG